MNNRSIILDTCAGTWNHVALGDHEKDVATLDLDG